MPIQFDGDLARFNGVCGVEEALPLQEWLTRTASPCFDLAPCTGLHTALLQVLMAAKAELSAPPQDPFLQRWVAPLLSGRASAPTE